MLSFVKDGLICEYRGTSRKNFYWEGNKVIVEKDGLGGCYGQRRAKIESFGAASYVKCSSVMVKGKNGIFQFCAIRIYFYYCC